MKLKVMLAILFIAFSLVSVSAFSQAGINANSRVLNNSAMLDVKSTDKGFLPPRMFSAQRNSILTPEEGLVIYNTDEQALNVYNGNSCWSMLQTLVCGNSMTIYHLAVGFVAPVNKTVIYSTVLSRYEY